jgi:small subunit ribosomal protein S2
MVDTCADPTLIDYVIPANDDATKSIEVVLDAVCAAIVEGLAERKLEKDKEGDNADGEGDENSRQGKGTGRQRTRKMNREEVDIPSMDAGRNADGETAAAPAEQAVEVETPAEVASPAEAIAEELTATAEPEPLNVSTAAETAE